MNPLSLAVPDLLEEVRALAAEADVAAVAAFDADGTLWTGDVGQLLFETAVQRAVLRPQAAAALAGALAELGEASSGDLHADAWRLFELYREDRFGELETCAMMAWCFAGWTAPEVRGLAREVLEAGGHPGRIYEGLGALIDGLRGHGLRILVASGSPAWMVEEACRPLGITADCIFAMTPSTSADGRIEPSMRGPLTYREGKVEALRAATGGRRALVAFGDSVGDLPMLEDAQLAVAVAARPTVLAQARRNPARWRILAIDRTRGGHPVVAPSVDRMVI